MNMWERLWVGKKWSRWHDTVVDGGDDGSGDGGGDGGGGNCGGDCESVMTIQCIGIFRVY